MAGSVTNVVKVTGSTVTSLVSPAFTSTTGSAFVAVTNDPAAGGATPVSDNKGNTYTALASQIDAAATLRAYYKENGAGGAGHAATFSFAANADPTCFFAEVAGVASASLDSGSLATIRRTASPFTITSGTLAQADEIVLAFMGSDGGTTTYSESTGFTINSQEGNNGSFWTAAFASKVVNATAAVTPSFTVSGGAGTASLIVVGFKAGASVPTITKQPSNLVALENSDCTFSVTATFAGSSPSYQWQSDDSGTWTDIPGATASSCVVASPAKGNGYSVRCNVTDSNGTSTSASASLLVLTEGRVAAWTLPMHGTSLGGLKQPDVRGAGLAPVLVSALLSPPSGGGFDPTPITGVVSITLAELTLAATGVLTGGTPSGSVEVTLAPLTLVSTGVLAITGQANITLGALTTSGSAVLAVTGASSTTLAPLTLVATGALAIAGQTSVTLAAMSVDAAGALAIKGQASVTLNALSVGSAGSLALSSSASNTLAPLTVVATGVLPIKGTAAITLAPMAVSASGSTSSLTLGAVSHTLAPLTVSATGVLPIKGSAEVTLEPLTVSAAATLRIAAAASISLGELSLVSSGSLAIQGALSVTLDPLSMSAAGASFQPEQIVAVLASQFVGTGAAITFDFSIVKPSPNYAVAALSGGAIASCIDNPVLCSASFNEVKCTALIA